MTQEEQVIQATGREPMSCSCKVCKNMCKVNPCFGTPAEMKAIVDAGYGDKLMLSFWLDVKNVKIEPLVCPEKTESGCIFQNDDGLCELHDKRLKPLEGRLANHNQTDEGLRRSVVDLWCSPQGVKMLRYVHRESKRNRVQRVIELGPGYSSENKGREREKD